MCVVCMCVYMGKGCACRCVSTGRYMCALRLWVPAVLWSLLSGSTWLGFPSVEYLPLLSLRLGASQSQNQSKGQEQALSLALFSEAPHFCPLSSFPGLHSCLRAREPHIMS